MSMTFVENGNIISFSEFMLSESIKPTICDYGTNDDLNNKDFLTMISGKNANVLVYTFTKINNIFYFIGVTKKGNVMFSSADSIDINNLDDIVYIQTHFLEHRRRTKNVLQVFGKIIYIILQALNQHDMKNVKYIRFNGADEGLGRAYAVMVKNKYLIKEIEEYGFKYVGVDEDKNEYIFVRL